MILVLIILALIIATILGVPTVASLGALVEFSRKPSWRWAWRWLWTSVTAVTAWGLLVLGVVYMAQHPAPASDEPAKPAHEKNIGAMSCDELYDSVYVDRGKPGDIGRDAYVAQCEHEEQWSADFAEWQRQHGYR